MKKVLPFQTVLLLFIACMLSSCSAIEGIFKAGVWTGIVVVIVIIVIVILIIGKLTGKK